MNCHIVPIVYLRSWATKETIGEKRPKFKTYAFNKNEIDISVEASLMEKLDSIKIVDFYILDWDNQRHLDIISSELFSKFSSVQDIFDLDLSGYRELSKLIIEKKHPKLNKWVEEEFGSYQSQKDGSVVKSIEQFLGKIEKRWGDFSKQIPTFTSRGNMVKAISKDNLLEFASIQAYRNLLFIEPRVLQAVNIVNSAIPKEFKINNIETHAVLLKQIYNYRKYKTNRKEFKKNYPQGLLPPIAKTIKDFNELQCSFIVASDKSSFITSDNPFFSIGADVPYTGLYMPLSPKVCLFLFKCKIVLPNKYIIMDANINIVNFVNSLTVKNSISQVFSNRTNLTTSIQHKFPARDFLQMFSNCNLHLLV